MPENQQPPGTRPYADLLREIGKRLDEDLADLGADFYQALAGAVDSAGRQELIEGFLVDWLDAHARLYVFLVPGVISVETYVEALQAASDAKVKQFAEDLHICLSTPAKLRVASCISRWKAGAMQRARKWQEASISAPSTVNASLNANTVEGLDRTRHGLQPPLVGVESTAEERRPNNGGLTESEAGLALDDRLVRANELEKSSLSQNGLDASAELPRPSKRRGRRANEERRAALHDELTKYGDGWRDHLGEIFTGLDTKEVELGDFAGRKIDLGDGQKQTVRCWDDLDFAEGEGRKQIIDVHCQVRSAVKQGRNNGRFPCSAWI
ncbi:MAG TPA: hypothetical protein VH639_29575 [Bryobacteraceae bacterium]|jgi:hypothetical protein